MILKKVCLFQTPLDPDYNSVFDVNNASWLSNHNIGDSFNINNVFPEFTAYLRPNIDPQDKAFTLNKNSEFTFKYDATTFDFVRKCNWAIFTSINNEDYYYFITSYVVNDNFSAITIKLKWDAWTNNLMNITNNKDLNFIENRHIDDFYIDHDIVRTKNYSTEEKEVNSHSIVLNHVGWQRYNILYLRLWLDMENLKFVYETIESVIENYNGLIPTVNPIGVINIPYAVVDSTTREIVDSAQIYNVGENQNLPFFYPSRLNTILENSTNYNLITPSILFADLTYHPQFKFTYSYNSINNTLTINYTDDIHKVSEYYGFVQLKTGTQLGNAIQGFCSPLEYTDTLFPKEYSPIIESLTYDLPAIPYQSDYTTKSENNIDKYEPRIHQFPFEYISYKYGENNIIIRPKYNVKELYLTQRVKNRINPHISLRYENEEKEYKYYNGVNNGTIPIAKDSLAEFLRNNSAQIIEKQMENLTLLAISTLSMNIPAIIGAGTKTIVGGLRTGVQLYDVNKAQDIYQIPSTFACDNMNYQDDLVRIYNTIADEKMHDEILKNFVLYGVNYQNTGKVSENTRNNFDFIKTSNCRLPNIKNNEDRKIIENAFDRGIRKWHIDTCYIEALKNFDLEYTNLQKSIYTGNSGL